MNVNFKLQDKKYRVDLNHPLDISIPLKQGGDTVNCFYAPLMEIWPVEEGDFVGSTARGGSLNFMNVKFNPHGNGTHTECVGHISKEPYKINGCLRRFHFPAKVVSIYPTRMENGDRIILRKQLEAVYERGEPVALIIRTLPNPEDKLRRVYSGTNPPYVHHDALDYLVEAGVEHLLIDLPSVDREEDGGQLLGHKTYWKYPGTEEAGRLNCTISELIYVPEKVQDGYYLLNLQIASFELDVSPSKPVLYALEPM